MKRIHLILFICLMTIPGMGQIKVARYEVAGAPWDEDLGNHRAAISVTESGDAVYIYLPWRRRDVNPENKRIIVTDQQGKEMKNIFRININREFGEFVFQPESGAGNYFIYYMPYKGNKNMGWFDGDYMKTEDLPDAKWVLKNMLSPDFDLKKSGIPEARLNQIQSRSAFDSFFPMEVCATSAEVSQLTGRFTENWLAFPEDRKYPVRMTNDLPYRWIEKGPSKQFEGIAMQNEYYAFQIGVFAAKKDLEDLTVSYGDYAERITCFNLGGIDPEGNPFTKRVDVPKGRIQALWFGIDIPRDAPAGEYTASITIKPANDSPQVIAIKIRIENKVLADRGDSEPWRHSRLRWLNSRLGINDAIVAPYSPLEVEEKTIKCFMRSIRLNDQGFISNISSGDIPVLSRPMQFIVETDAGIEELTSRSFRYTGQNAGKVSWTAESTSDNLSLTCNGTMEFDGHVGYSVHLKASGKLKVKDIRLLMPVRKEIAQYFMGLGLPGSKCPDNYSWKWKGPQDSYWIGTVNAGFHCELQGAAYHGPMLNLYHPAPPESWYNLNKGGFNIMTGGKEVVASAFSGERTLTAGEEIAFEFALLITPVKKLNTSDQFINRYYHHGGKPSPAIGDLKSGIRITNVHHANAINPYINYPFIAVDSMKNFVNQWHHQGLKVKIYYTIRELTNQVPEIWALRSLDTEIFAGGPGGGYPWLREHLVENYQVQWFNPILGYQACDAAILTNGQSRWYNYYIEGLGWLVKNLDIDGLYLDDVAFDRNMLKRMRKVMDGIKPGCLLDLHSNTAFSIGPANQYAEYFPYINKLWFGEGFQYDKMPPENWITEVSGIPFGLMGDMLQGGGNPWRGMIYGMTVRYPWSTDGVYCDPRDIWKIWDQFGIDKAEMKGYWDAACPVKTSNPKVLATAYVQNGKTLVSVASWAQEKCQVKLVINWKALGLDPLKAKISTPAIPNFQLPLQYKMNAEIPVEPMKGLLLLIE